MVRTRTNEVSELNIDAFQHVLKIVGRTLTLRKKTVTTDDFGKVTAISNSDTSFTGDLQSGIDLDKRYVNYGIVKFGEGILYYDPTLSVSPVENDVIIDGSNHWEVVSRIENPIIDGDSCHYTYRCRRRQVDN